MIKHFVFWTSLAVFLILGITAGAATLAEQIQTKQTLHSQTIAEIADLRLVQKYEEFQKLSNPNQLETFVLFSVVSATTTKINAVGGITQDEAKFLWIGALEAPSSYRPWLLAKILLPVGIVEFYTLQRKDNDCVWVRK